MAYTALYDHDILNQGMVYIHNLGFHCSTVYYIPFAMAT